MASEERLAALPGLAGTKSVFALPECVRALLWARLGTALAASLVDSVSSFRPALLCGGTEFTAHFMLCLHSRRCNSYFVT